MNLSFAGCGFLGIYHVGVACCFREYAPDICQPNGNRLVKISGASAGALTAAGLLCDVDLGQATTDVLRVATKARSRALGPLHPSFQITKILRDGLLFLLPDNAHEICTGRLHISLTRVCDRKNVVINEFCTKDELIHALLCSSFVPIWSGFIPPKYRGERYIDGGLTNNIPILDEHTITVCPLAGESDISPDDYSSNYLHLSLSRTSVQMTTENLYRLTRAFFPPHPEVLSAWCKQGFEDALRFLQRNNMIDCTRCLTLRTIIPMMEEASDAETSDTESAGGSPTVEEHEYAYPQHPLDNCEDCRKLRHKLVKEKDLPKPVSSALQEAIDSHSGIIAYICHSRLARLLSVLTLPWVLPFDIALHCGLRFIEYIPYLKADFVWFVGQLVNLIAQLIHRINKDRHTYSARLTCQFALTEFHQEEEERPTANQPALQRNMSFGISVDLEADAVRNAGFVLRNLSSRSMAVESDQVVQAALQLEEEGLTRQREQLDAMSADTYENFVDVARTHDSLMAYYYLDENERIKVTEIFDVSNVDLPVNPTELYNYAPNEMVVNFEIGGEEVPRSRRPSRHDDGRRFSRSSANKYEWHCRSRTGSMSNRPRSRASSYSRGGITPRSSYTRLANLAVSREATWSQSGTNCSEVSSNSFDIIDTDCQDLGAVASISSDSFVTVPSEIKMQSKGSVESFSSYTTVASDIFTKTDPP